MKNFNIIPPTPSPSHSYQDLVQASVLDPKFVTGNLNQRFKRMIKYFMGFSYLRNSKKSFLPLLLKCLLN